MFIDLEDNIVKMIIFPKLMYRFIAILIKFLAGIFAEIKKLILKLIWKYKGPRIAKTISNNENKDKRVTLPYFKNYKESYCKEDYVVWA